MAGGRPILYNAVAVNDAYPERFRHQLRWLKSCAERGIRVFGQGATLEAGFAFTFKDWNLVLTTCRRGTKPPPAQSKIG